MPETIQKILEWMNSLKEKTPWKILEKEAEREATMEIMSCFFDQIQEIKLIRKAFFPILSGYGIAILWQVTFLVKGVSQ